MNLSIDIPFILVGTKLDLRENQKVFWKNWCQLNNSLLLKLIYFSLFLLKIKVKFESIPLPLHKWIIQTYPSLPFKGKNNFDVLQRELFCLKFIPGNPQTFFLQWIWVWNPCYEKFFSKAQEVKVVVVLTVSLVSILLR